MFDDTAQRTMLEGVKEKFESGTSVLREDDIEDVSERAGLSLAQGKQLLGSLVSPDGPIVGEPIISEEHGMVGISVDEVDL